MREIDETFTKITPVNKSWLCSRTITLQPDCTEYRGEDGLSTRVQAWVIEYMQVPFIETQHSIY